MTDNRGNYARVNGINLYYEIQGSGGTPLVVLPGGFMHVDSMGLDTAIAALAKTRQIIAVEQQGHGHTEDIDRPITYEGMADDIAALLDHLGIEKADILGYSLGGGTAWQIAIRHATRVRKLAVLSEPARSSAWYPSTRRGMLSMTVEGMKQWLYEPYAKVAPNPDHFARLITKVRTLLEQDYDWSDAVKALAMPVLLAAGDADNVSLTSVVEEFALLGGGQGDGDEGNKSKSRLAILPGTTHLTILAYPGLVDAVIVPFLDADA